MILPRKSAPKKAQTPRLLHHSPMSSLAIIWRSCEASAQNSTLLLDPIGIPTIARKTRPAQPQAPAPLPSGVANRFPKAPVQNSLCRTLRSLLSLPKVRKIRWGSFAHLDENTENKCPCPGEGILRTLTHNEQRSVEEQKNLEEIKAVRLREKWHPPARHVRIHAPSNSECFQLTHGISSKTALFSAPLYVISF